MFWEGYRSIHVGHLASGGRVAHLLAGPDTALEEAVAENQLQQQGRLNRRDTR